MKKIAYFGTNGNVSFTEKGFDHGFNAVGHNTGNLMFQYALWKKIKNPKFNVDLNCDPYWVRENADLLVIPAANQVNPAWDLKWWGTFIEKIDLPVVILGLGAQAEDSSNTNLTLQEGTLKFLQEASKRTSSIGVRGAFTQQVLFNAGIKNTTITGCPTQTISDAISGESIQKNIDDLKLRSKTYGQKIRLGYLMGTMEPFCRDYEKKLFQSIADENFDIILQTSPASMKAAFGFEITDEEQKNIDWVGNYLLGNRNFNFFSEKIKSGKIYSSAAYWIDDMLKYDAVIGMRIHGAIAAIQSGKLGICVVFDSRTLELCETMGYPYIDAKKLASPKMSLHEILELIEFDAENFNSRRTDLIKKIETILEDAGCEIQK
ncbi:polysaccharide pyruvyl transferase family protein [Cellvibrio sp. NN19]|uniref:polysaccharide pyruvyl transferase family protein n=1 Tax=Cellvibrio chitinivorans TaxID=3102792 RepID=UPI002B405945|nr:polysaccharide pyruvyl transferase family protein [Cellvibrio sp. NN19]